MLDWAPQKEFDAYCQACEVSVENPSEEALRNLIGTHDALVKKIDAVEAKIRDKALATAAD